MWFLNLIFKFKPQMDQERLEKQELQRQLDFVARIIKNIKTKSYPVVLGLTKFDLLKPSNNDQSTDHDQSTDASSGAWDHRILEYRENLIEF